MSEDSVTMSVNPSEVGDYVAVTADDLMAFHLAIKGVADKQGWNDLRLLTVAQSWVAQVSDQIGIVERRHKDGTATTWVQK